MPKLINLLSYDIAEDIQKYIFENNLNHEDKIPSERELSEKYNVTRVTLRNGLQRLIDQGVIYNVPNSGYFVSQKKILRDASNYFFPKSDIFLKDLNYSKHALDLSKVNINLSSSKILIQDIDNIIENGFIEKVNDKPISITYILQNKNTLPKYPNLFSSEKKPENIIQKQKIQVYNANDDELKLLAITNNDSLFLVREVISDSTDLIATCESICVGTRCRLQTNINV